MPRRTDLKRVLVIGSGPIVIGQACEFDYSGTPGVQGAARRGARGHPRQQQPGDDHDRPGAGRPHLRRAAHARGRSRRSSSASAPTRCCRRSAGRRRSTWRWISPTAGTLDKYDVELIGASIEAIKVAEDRLLFKDAMRVDRPRRAAERPRALAGRGARARRRRSASRSSSGRRSRSAASAAASPTTSRNSAIWPSAASS